MSERSNISKAAPEAHQAMYALQQYVNGSGLPPVILRLITVRASQINGCAYCINMHVMEARKAGETEQRLFLLDTWKEVKDLYTEEERIALALTEEVTLIKDHGLSEETFQKSIRYFGEKGTTNLIMAVVTINGWNRICISLQVQPH